MACFVVTHTTIIWSTQLRLEWLPPCPSHKTEHMATQSAGTDHRKEDSGVTITIHSPLSANHEPLMCTPQSS